MTTETGRREHQRVGQGGQDTATGFTLAGRTFDLDAASVRTALRGQAPLTVRRHYVEVDGVRWPVKQVIALATGLNPNLFQSYSSRRVLQRLGFTVGEARAPQPSKPRPPDAAAGTSLVHESGEVLETVQTHVRFDWRRAGPVVLDARGLPTFPALSRLPGLYRFEFVSADAVAARTLYIGESVDLARRSRNYRNATSERTRQRTSRRIHRELVAHLNKGGSVSFDVSTEVTVSDLEADLRLASVRRLAENAAVFTAQVATGLRVLNIDADIDLASAEDEAALKGQGTAGAGGDGGSDTGCEGATG